MDTLTERLERLAELQKQSIEPIRHLGDNAFTAFERMARKNYELMGDMVEYAVAQSRGSIEQSSPQALYERQMDEARAFAERMSERAAEYLALAEQMRGEMTPDSFEALAGTTGGAESSVAPARAPKASPADTTASKVAAKTASSKKAVSKKAVSKKAVSKKASSKKASSKKASAKKASSKKAGSKKSAARKSSSR